jgi:hypothetical protein
MDKTLTPAFNMMNDYVQNYTTGNVDVAQRIRALNRAIEDIHRTLGLTCDETIFSFQYLQNSKYTNLPTDYDEPITLVYQDDKYNIPGQGWTWQPYTYLLKNSGFSHRTFQKFFGSTNINGSKQLIQSGVNIHQGSIINAFNNTNLVSTTGDATTLVVDNNVFINVGGSLSFTIDPTKGHGYAGIKVSGFGIMNVQQALQNNGVYGVYSYLPTTNISLIELILTSANGSYTFFATTQNDTLPFEIDEWNQTNYPWKLASITGSPDSTEITSYEVRYIEGAGFGAVAIPYFRIDDFFLQFPDEMDLIYYSQYKGTDSTGVTPKIFLDSLSDIPNFMLFFPDFLNMVALRAAYILGPQLSMDYTYRGTLKSDYFDQLKDYGKIYPRKKCINLGQTLLRRP